MFEAFIQYLISNNIPEYTILMLLYLPVVSTFIAFSRYIIGWKSLSVYSSILLVYALLEAAHVQGGSFDVGRGLMHGSTLILTISLVALAIEGLIRDVRLHYLAKVSIITTIITAVVFFMLYAAVEIQAANFIRLSPMTFVIMILVLDIFMKGYMRKGHKKALIFIGNTIGLSLIVFALMAQPFTRDTMLAFPEIALATIVINLFLGSWRSLRLSEYIRFKDIHLKEINDPQRDSEQK